MLNEEDLKEVFERMAAVDGQNASDPLYQPMAGHFDTSMAYEATCDLVYQRTGTSERLHRAAAACLALECEGDCGLEDAIKLIAVGEGIDWAGGEFDA